MGNRKYAGEYTRVYKDLRGVDMCGDGAEISKNRLAACVNMYKDYEAEGAPVIESIPGYRRLFSLGEPINALFCHSGAIGEVILALSGCELYLLRTDSEDSEPEHLITLDEPRALFFSFGNCAYIISGYRMLKLNEYGSIYELGEEEMTPYVPTLYLNGAPYEQRNLLTEEFAEEFLIGDCRDYLHGTPSLTYRVLDEDLHTVSVSGVEDGHTGALYIPSRIRLGETLYSVERIDDNAFAYKDKITEVYIGQGVREIGIFAFRMCTGITKIVTPSSLEYIGNAAFMDCANMTDIYLGGSLCEVGSAIFSACINLATVHYEGDEASLALIRNKELLELEEIAYGSVDTSALAELTLCSRAVKVKTVRLNGISRSFTEVYKDGEPVRILLPLERADILTGGRVRIEATLSPIASALDTDFISTEDGQAIGGKYAILGCTLAESFDGRIFYSGNPALPNTVFYTARRKNGLSDPTYVGSYNYFNDGMSSYPVVSLLSVRDSLAVFKAGDDGTGSIFYHVGRDTDSDLVPRIYPTESVHSGICAIGGSASFLDDPVFLTRSGLMALDRRDISYERSVVNRSHNVAYELMRENLSRAVLTEWCGYLVVGVGSHVYLADSRATFKHDTGGVEYEWFCLDGIGEWRGSKRVFVYSSVAEGGLLTHPYPDTECTEEVYETDLDGRTLYYARIGTGRYAVEPTGELKGGEFIPATVYLGVGDRLFFGTEGGGVLVFNSDKRGVPPDFIKNSEDFDAQDYSERMGRQIHPAFYSFDGHAATYLITTARDDCGISNMTKSTVPRSTVLKCKAFSRGELTVDVGTDRSGYSELCRISPGELSFRELDFSRLSLTSGRFFSIPIGEREKGWLDKQYTVYSSSYCCPLGILSITYRFTVKGNLKKQ